MPSPAHPPCSATELATISGKATTYYATLLWLTLASLVYQRVLLERAPHEARRLHNQCADPSELLRAVHATSGRVRTLAAANVVVGVALLTALHPCAGYGVTAISRHCRAAEPCTFYYPLFCAVAGVVYLWHSANLAAALGLEASGGTSLRKGGGGSGGTAGGGGAEVGEGEALRAPGAVGGVRSNTTFPFPESSDSDV